MKEFLITLEIEIESGYSKLQYLSVVALGVDLLQNPGILNSRNGAYISYFRMGVSPNSKTITEPHIIMSYFDEIRSDPIFQSCLTLDHVIKNVFSNLSETFPIIQVRALYDILKSKCTFRN